MQTRRSCALALCLLGLLAPPCVSAIGPRVVGREEILELVDEWIYNFDEDEDGFVNQGEMSGLLGSLREQSSMPAESSAHLTPELVSKMADSDGDGKFNRAELIDLMYRMKGFDAGHLSRTEANIPGSADAEGQDYGKSHEERMRAKKKKKRKKKAAKDEV